MNKANKMFNIKTTLLLLVLASSLIVFGYTSVLFSQVVWQKEVCNGVDDNGDGQVDENLNCDHYLSYLIDKPIKPINVVLHDQFIDPTDFQLVFIERLLNPVRKIHNGLRFDPKRLGLHYLAYQLKTYTYFQPRPVLIENQFEKRAVLVTNPRYLLTPTGKIKAKIPIDKITSLLPLNLANAILEKTAPSIPKNANHYLCYDIEPYDVSTSVFVRDQFQRGNFEVIKALYLCNPVEKIHNESVSEIVDQNSHIMCYEVIPHNQVNRNVTTRDQFGLKSQNTIRTEEVCVPTIKTELPNCDWPDGNGIVDHCFD
ncbi:MAG: hypothetical protein AAB340_01010 [Patescibacteria group bacterium]